jgi:hypothetical protein
MLKSNHDKNSEDDMRANCPYCDSTIPVKTSKKIAAGLRSGYSKCSNTECEKFDITLVFNLSFSHCVEKKTQNVIDDIQALINQLPAHQRSLALEGIAS